MQYNVIIPCFNSGSYIFSCLESVYIASQSDPELRVSVFCIDDGSTDHTISQIKNFCIKFPLNIEIIQNTSTQHGPGICRNIGIEALSSEDSYVLFLDSDDHLFSHSLRSLHASALSADHINSDIFIFNYFVTPDQDLWRKFSLSASHYMLRKDAHLFKNKQLLVQSFLEMKIDPSVIFMAFRLSFLRGNNLLFRSGLHEDIDFSFSAYLNASSFVLLTNPLYCKTNRPDSIVNTFSFEHIQGYLEAWDDILSSVETQDFSAFGLSLSYYQLVSYFRIGIRGALGVLISMNSCNPAYNSESALYCAMSSVLDEYPKLKAVFMDSDQAEFTSRYDQLSLPLFQFLLSV